MNKKEQIYELLLKEELTIKEISERLAFKEDYTRTTILRLKNEEKAICIGKNGNSKIYRAKIEDSLEKEIIKKFIPKFLDNDLDVDFTDKEFNLVREIFEEIRQNA